MGSYRYKERANDNCIDKGKGEDTDKDEIKVKISVRVTKPFVLNLIKFNNEIVTNSQIYVVQRCKKRFICNSFSFKDTE